MLQFSLAIVFLVATTTHSRAETLEDSFVSTFLECDASITAFLQETASEMNRYAVTAELKPVFYWFQPTEKLSDGDGYVVMDIPMKVAGVTVVGAAYSYQDIPSFGTFEFWGLYFKEDMASVYRALTKFAVVREMKRMDGDGEHYARLRLKSENGKTIEWVNILEPKNNTPFDAGSYLSCSLQPRL